MVMLLGVLTRCSAGVGVGGSRPSTHTAQDKETTGRMYSCCT
jgi:hypothetical protein